MSELPSVNESPNPPRAEEEVTIASLVAENGDGRRTFRRLAWILAGIALVCTALAFLYPIVWPGAAMEAAAQKILQMPVGARVVKEVDGPRQETGEVWFELPEPKGKGSRVAEICTLNNLPVMPAPAPPKTSGKAGTRALAASPATKPSTYLFNDGIYRKTLTYDATTRQYHFKCSLVR